MPSCAQEYWRSRRVPKELRQRIISSLNQKHRGRKIIDEDVLLRDITPNLRWAFRLGIVRRLTC
jgi:hypothetical protein